MAHNYSAKRDLEKTRFSARARAPTLTAAKIGGSPPALCAAFDALIAVSVKVK